MADVIEATDKILNKELTITDVEKDEFFRCFLEDESYTEEVSLFAGKFKVKFKTLTINENNEILTQIKLDEKAGTAEETDQYFITISMYRLGLALIAVNGVPFNTDANPQAVALSQDTDLTLTKLKAEVFKDWPTYKLTAVIDAFRTFEQKVIKLTAEVTDPNFWKAAK